MRIDSLNYLALWLHVETCYDFLAYVSVVLHVVCCERARVISEMGIKFFEF